jgi:tetratricopeptide (TPR) repeat protein
VKKNTFLKLIRKEVLYPCVVLLLLALPSCAKTVIHMRDLAELRVGMAPDEPPRVMGVPPNQVFQWSMATTGDPIIVQSYVLATGEYWSTYFLAYRNDALIFWGYPQEFAKSSDPLLREIGKRVISGGSSYRGDWESEIKEYEQILESDPDQQRVRLRLTYILIRKREFESALIHLDKLIQQDPNMVMAHYYRGRIHLELKNYSEAEKSYLDALRLNERMEPALFDLGSLYQMLQQYEKAAEIYERLLRFYPDNATGRERLIGIYYQLGQKDKAEKEIEELKKQFKPGDPGRQTLGLIYLRHGKIDESIAELDLIVSAWPEDHKSRYYLATAYEEKGTLDNALSHFRLVSKESRYFLSAQEHIAYILERQKNTMKP